MSASALNAALSAILSAGQREAQVRGVITHLFNSIFVSTVNKSVSAASKDLFSPFSSHDAFSESLMGHSRDAVVCFGLSLRERLGT